MAFTRKPDEWVEIEGTIERQTEKAVCFFRSDLDKPEWYPKSHFRIVQPSTPEDPNVVAEVTKWIYGEKEKERNQK